MSVRFQRCLNQAASVVWGSVNLLARTVGEITTKADLGLPVISVGNLQAGGSGKTPVVLEVVKLLKDQGKRPVIVTRGYRSKAEHGGGILFGERSSRPQKDFGDEAVLLHEKTGCPVFVGKDRERTFMDFAPIFLASEKPNVLVLDDGFQQFKLKKDLEILCITSKGRSDVVYREFSRAVKPEHFLVLTKSEDGGVGSPSFTYSAQVELLPDLSEIASLDSLDSQKTGFTLLTGFSGAERLKDQLEERRILISKWHDYSDHHNYSKSEIQQIEKGSAGRMILTSEKDWVKIRRLTERAEQYRVIRLDLKWKFGKMELIDRLCKLFPES